MSFRSKPNPMLRKVLIPINVTHTATHNLHNLRSMRRTCVTSLFLTGKNGSRILPILIHQTTASANNFASCLFYLLK